VTVIIVIEFAVGAIAIVTGFGFKHTYLVSYFTLVLFIIF